VKGAVEPPRQDRVILKFPLAEDFCTPIFAPEKTIKINALISVQNCYDPEKWYPVFGKEHAPTTS
jgi:hypothetical protein